jgi:uncharacterized SAM-binding protein YcdF (DUF218 family)
MTEIVRLPTLLFVATALGLGWLWYRRRETRSGLLAVSAPFAALGVISLPAVAHLALGTLEWRYPTSITSPDGAGAIVVLSGSLAPADGVRGRAGLGDDTLYRCLHAAEVYRRAGPLPVLASGGKVDPAAPGPTLARAMADFLREQGVAAEDLILEERSRTTFENAVESARVLRARGIKRVVLVTEAVHMYRASLCFLGQGLEVTPAPCHPRARGFICSLSEFLPHPAAAQRFQLAVHEWLGVAWYRLRGRI